MAIRATTTVLLLQGWLLAAGQCLVADPGFEQHKDLPYSEAQLYFLHHWFSPNPAAPVAPNATPDFLHTEGSSYASLPYSRFGTTYPAAGQGCGGFLARSGAFPDFREYLSTALTAPLEPGKAYEVRLKITQGAPTPDSLYGVFASSHVGCWLSETRPRQYEHEPLTFASPQWESKEPIVTTSWREVVFAVTPARPLYYLTIGCFRADKQVRQQHYRTGLPPIEAGFSYYFVDEVQVCAVPASVPEKPLPMVQQPLPARPVAPVLPPDAPAVDERKRDHQGRFRVRGDSLSLRIFDAGAEDKDTISVFFNGEWVMRRSMVHTRAQVLTLPLLKGRNELIVFAHNTGTVPPNTAVLAWEIAGKTKRLKVVSDLSRCAVVEFIR